MAVRSRSAVPITRLPAQDFSGGLNLRDAPSSLAPNESPDMMNVTLDERGGIQKRLGQRKWNATVYPGGTVKQTFEWKSAAKVIVQAGGDLYEGTSTTAFKTFTTSARVGLADFVGKLCIIHPVDGLFTWDGATLTAIADPDAPKGDVLYPWQNKLWAAGNPINKARVAWSAINDPAAWAAADFNDLREKDGEQVVALKGAAGESIATGEQGLCAFKQRSAYRITDSTTGAYVTIDATVGAASALAVVADSGRLITLSEAGIFWTDGFRAMRNASEQLAPLWRQLARDQLALFCAGVKEHRVRFSLARAGSTVNDLALEYHVAQGWIVPHSNPMSCYATITESNKEKLIGGSPSVSGQVYELDVGGSDDGAAIAARYQVRWLNPAVGARCSFRRLRLEGRGVLDVEILLDFDEQGQGETVQAVLAGGALVWGVGQWGVDEWGPGNYEDHDDLWSLGEGRYISFVFKETSKASASAPQVLGSGAAPEVGAFAVYGFQLDFIPKGGA